MKLPIYKCSNCKQLQDYQGKGKPHCGKCGTPLTEKDIDGYYEAIIINRVWAMPNRKIDMV